MKKGKLLILTTNLSIDELREKYGERTVDRLRAITKTVLFTGESLRGWKSQSIGLQRIQIRKKESELSLIFLDTRPLTEKLKV